MLSRKGFSLRGGYLQPQHAGHRRVREAIWGQAGVFYLVPLEQDSRAPADPITAYQKGFTNMRVSVPPQDEPEWGVYCYRCYGYVRTHRSEDAPAR